MALALIGNICRWIWAFALPPVVNTSSMFSNHKYYLHLEGNLTTYSRMQCVSEQEIHHRKDPIKRDTKEGNQKRREGKAGGGKIEIPSQDICSCK